MGEYSQRSIEFDANSCYGYVLDTECYLTMTRFDPKYGHVRYRAEGKAHLEAMLCRHPNDRQLLLEYFEFLREMSRRSFGLMQAKLPSYKFPIYFRANTSDILNMKQVFVNREYDFEVNYEPRHLLDLGAYCGYASIFLAHRFSQAEIFAIEPSNQNFEVLTANTIPYPNIRRLNAAVWSHSTRVRLDQRLGGQWGSIFKQDELQGNVSTYSVNDIFRIAGWDSADFIKCDIEGAEVEIFSASDAQNWIKNARLISVETHDRFRSDSTSTVVSALEDDFIQFRSGEFLVFTREGASDADSAISGQDNEGKLIWQTPYFQDMELANVDAAPWGIMLIDDETLQLHPNPPSAAPAEAIFRFVIPKGLSFRTQCQLPPTSQGAVIFGLQAVQSAKVLISEEISLSPGDDKNWTVDLSGYEGAVTLRLSTSMAPEATSPGGAWARWLRPAFVLTDRQSSSVEG